MSKPANGHSSSITLVPKKRVKIETDEEDISHTDGEEDKPVVEAATVEGLREQIEDMLNDLDEFTDNLNEHGSMLNRLEEKRADMDDDIKGIKKIQTSILKQLCEIEKHLLIKTVTKK